MWRPLFDFLAAEPLHFLQGHSGPAYDVKFYGEGEDCLLLRFVLMLVSVAVCLEVNYHFRFLLGFGLQLLDLDAMYVVLKSIVEEIVFLSNIDFWVLQKSVGIVQLRQLIGSLK